MRQTATITMTASKPQPPATPPAIGPARELLITGVNAEGGEAAAEDGSTACEDVVNEVAAVVEGNAVEDGTASEPMVLLVSVELAGTSFDSN